MPLTIWKFPLRVVREQTVEMPRSARVLSAQFQDCVLCLWALVDTRQPYASRVIYVDPTGVPLDRLVGIHISTVQDDAFVWHVFDGGER